MKFRFQFLLFLTVTTSVVAQRSSLSEASEDFFNYSRLVVHEKIFVHTDRTFYITGDYLWFKIYAVDATYHQKLGVSKVAYVELVDKDNHSVVQTKVSLNGATGDGSVFLPASLSSGNYILRAYTRWMRNFDPSFYFHKAITVVNPFKPLEAPVASQINDAPDVQFFPEGGQLVNGLESKVAFRVVNRAGYGMAFNGVVLDEQGVTVAQFEPLKFGIGHFYFKPEAGKNYKAILYDSLHRSLGVAQLPPALERGYVMNLREAESELVITVRHSHSTREGNEVGILIHTRQSVCFNETHDLKSGLATFRVSKAALGDGISHITIFENGLPVCERLYFKHPETRLTLDASTGRKMYTTRKKVRLELSALDNHGKMHDAHLSVSVYRLDTLQPSGDIDIRDYLMLTSDLQGRVESPEFYFTEDKMAEPAIDNLMLTHGWRRFVWNDVMDFDSSSLVFVPELRGQIVQGKVTSKENGEPAIGKLIYLSVPGKQFHFRGARSNRMGEVFFELPGFYGPGKLVVQPNFSEDSLCHVDITTPFSSRHSKSAFPAFTLSPAFEKEIVTRSINMQLQNTFFEQERSRLAKLNVDSTAFYGKPDQQFYLDNYTRFPVMEEVMREYVSGVMVRKRKDNFYFLVYNENDNSVYRTNPLVLLDGVPVFNINKIMEYDPLKVQRLDVITNRYFYGPLTFYGIVSYSTYRGDMPGFTLDSRALTIDYEGVQWKREFFSPVYETPEQTASRLPDFRDLLFWNPAIEMSQDGKHTVEFFTSDQPGKYVVVVQGISKSGAPASGTCTFEVSARENN